MNIIESLYLNKIRFEKEELIAVKLEGSEEFTMYMSKYKSIFDKIDHDFDKQNSKLNFLINQRSIKL